LAGYIAGLWLGNLDLRGAGREPHAEIYSFFS
jgi:hypothetical protein